MRKGRRHGGKGKVVQTRRSGTVNYFSTVKPRQKRDRGVRLSQSKDPRGERRRAGFPGRLHVTRKIKRDRGPRRGEGRDFRAGKKKRGWVREPLPWPPFPASGLCLDLGHALAAAVAPASPGAALRARPGRLHRPHLRQRRHLPGGGEARARCSCALELRQPRLSGARRPGVPRAPWRPRRPLLRALLRPRLRLRAGYGRAVRVPVHPTARAHCRSDPSPA